MIQTKTDIARTVAAGSFRRIALALAAAATLATSTALAANPSHWTQTTEADFRTGKFEHVVATNLGDLKLARDVKMLLDQDASVSAVYSLAQGPDGTVYAGTGPQGVLLRIKADKVETVLKLKDDTSISALAFDAKGRLLMGTVGKAGRILALDNPTTATADSKPTELFADKDIQYIWALAITPDQMIYAATGPTGKLLEIKPDGTHRAILETSEQNIVSLIAGDGDMLYAGTDPHGLVYRINRKTNQSFVMYDAAESEITALALDARGNLFVAASDASDESASAPVPSSEPGHGRPETPATGEPVPAHPPEIPAPPAKPQPAPGEPAPIPNEHDADRAESTKAVAPAAGNPADPAPADQKSAEPVLAGPASDDKTDKKPEDETASPLMDELHSRLKEAESQQEISSMEESDESEEPSGGHTGNPMEGIPSSGSGEGNVVYRIDPNGFVTEVFRQPAMVLSLIEQDGSLLVGTGGQEGDIYQIKPGSEETILLAKVDPKQVTCMLPAKDGRIILGLANSDALATMTAGFAPEGTFTSPVLDATQVSQFGQMHMTGRLPEKTELQIQTRSGNLQEADDKTWSPWSDPVPARQYLPVTSPTARFLQYRLILKSTDPALSPVVDDVDIAYQLPNIGPKVTSITITVAGNEDGPRSGGKPAGPTANPNRQIAWEAADPTGATLHYTISIRPEAGGPWIKIKDKLTEVQWLWNTRMVADGRYFVRVEASNAADAPDGQARTASRVSELIIVDNTPPVMGDLVWQKIPGGVKVSLRAADQTGTVASIHYCLDSADDWQAVPSSDKMFDSPSERAVFELHDLQPGQHLVTVRATDNQGNQSYENLLVTPGPQAK